VHLASNSEEDQDCFKHLLSINLKKYIISDETQKQTRSKKNLVYLSTVLRYRAVWSDRLL